MHAFRGKVLKVRNDYFAQVIQPPDDGSYAVNALVPLGQVPEINLRGQQFEVVDGKAYPTKGPVGAVPEAQGSDSPLSLGSPERWGWQKDALARWAEAGHFGIIEAVTGSGKTFLAMEAWRRQLERHRDTYTLVVVPSVTLQEQWFERLREQFPDKRIARLGNGRHEDFRDGKICVAVVNSVVGVGKAASEARLFRLFEHCQRHPQNRSFLIADECHHYIEADVFQRVRTLVKYNAVLALSATVGAHFKVSGLGEIVYSYTFADAVRRGDLPPLTLLNIKCELHADERRQYQSLSEAITDQVKIVQCLFPEEFDEEGDFSSDDFWQILKRLDREAGPDGEPAIRKLMVLLFKRTAIVYRSREKQSAALTLIQELLLSPRRRKVIVFFERILNAEDSAERVELEAARNCQSEVSRRGLWTGIIHSGLDDRERRTALDGFGRAERGILFACRMLDEGYDIPDVDAEVLVASTKSKRQRVQRIGRVLRRGDGKKQPVVLTLFCEQTTDRLVVANDRELFGEQTTIYEFTVNEALSFLRKQRRSEDGQDDPER